MSTSDSSNVDPSGDYDPEVPGSAPHVAAADGSDSLVTVVVPPGADQAAIARALLDAADSPADVQFGGDGFVVPQSVAEAAKLDGEVETVHGLATEPSTGLGEGSEQPVQLAEVDAIVAEEGEPEPAEQPKQLDAVDRVVEGKRKAPARKAPAKKAAAKTPAR